MLDIHTGTDTNTLELNCVHSLGEFRSVYHRLCDSTVMHQWSGQPWCFNDTSIPVRAVVRTLDHIGWCCVLCKVRCKSDGDVIQQSRIPIENDLNSVRNHNHNLAIWSQIEQWQLPVTKQSVRSAVSSNRQHQLCRYQDWIFSSVYRYQTGFVVTM